MKGMRRFFRLSALLPFFWVLMSAGEGAAENEFLAPVALRADAVSYLRAEGQVLAEGNVALRQGAWILLADNLSYDEATGMIRAWGNIAVSTPSGETIFAEEAAFTSALREGDAREVSMRLADDSRLAARTARLRGERSLLERAVYSACRPCEEDTAAGEATNPPPPIWRIKSYSVERNEGDGHIFYEDAWLEFFGVPIFYSPFFMHADPTVERQSGFLPPRFFSSSRLGFGAEFPYFWNLAPHYDFTFAPRFYSDGEFLWQGGWRQRTATGSYSLNAAAVLDNQDDVGAHVDDEFRAFLYGDGLFRASEEWRWGFRARAASDDTFPRRFDLSQETELVSSLFAEKQNPGELLRVHNYAFQGLLEDDRQTRSPVVLPLLEYKRALPDRHFGGRLRWEGNVLVLAREKGAQSRRASTSMTWEREIISRFGIVHDFQAQLRGDLYHVENVPYMPESDRNRGGTMIGRVLPTVGAQWRLPLTRMANGGRILVEPIAQLLLSPNGGNPSGIPNTDSASFEFDDTNLFAVDKFTGLDLWESGPRARYGVRGAFVDAAWQANLLFGQEYRLATDDSFAQLTGLRDHASDYVGSARLHWRGLTLEQRVRLDQENYHIRLHDMGAFGQPLERVGIRLRYAYLSEDVSTTGQSESELQVRGSYDLKRGWSAYAYVRRDLSRHKLVYTGAGVSYADECFSARLEFRNDFRRDRDVEPESAVFLRVALIGLGGGRGEGGDWGGEAGLSGGGGALER